MDLKETLTDLVKNIDVEEVKKQVVAHKEDIGKVIEKTPLKDHKKDIEGFIDKIL